MRVLVVGSGAIGLRTALEVARRKSYQVVLRSPFHPLDPRGCSQGAGGLWMPFRCDDSRVDRWALETLDELLSQQQQEEKGLNLIESLPTVFLRQSSVLEDIADLPLWTTDPRLSFQQTSLSELDNFGLKIPPAEDYIQAGYGHAWFFSPPIVNAPKMLTYMMQQLQEEHNVDLNVETGEFIESVSHLQDTAAKLGCEAVINCAGLGAAAICGDDGMEGARGILLHYDRATCARRTTPGNKDALLMVDEEPWGSETLPCYMIPRGDKLVIGGSYLPGDTNDSIRPEERTRLLDNARLLGIDTDKASPIGEWTGFRPKRASVRCEVDPDTASDAVRVVHNYGHGGSGWTINVGAAKECVDLLQKSV